MDRSTQDELAGKFLALHREGTFVLPNAWDAGSARILELAGFGAIATTSAGISFAAGRPDDGSIGRDEMLSRIAEIVGRVGVPVTADIESGYSPDSDGVAETIRRTIATGAVGANLEDADPLKPGGQYEAGEATDRVAAARQAADDEGVTFTLNARIDSFLIGHPEAMADSIARAALYVEAGADCIFLPGVTEKETMARAVEAIDAPINVVAGLAGNPLALAAYAELGVRRVSVGGSLTRASLQLVKDSAERMMAGDLDFTTDGIPYAEVNELMDPGR